jgi:7-cyano-7-deazaguanine synthase
MTAMPTEAWPPPSTKNTLAVLVSGGLDSAVMVGEAAKSYAKVYPIYVRTASFWEEVELAYLHRFLKELRQPAVQPLQTLDLPVRDLYQQHWSLNGVGIPDEKSPDEAVYLPGRNVILLSKALLWCHLNEVPQLAMALLSGNPFPDATAKFREAMTMAVNLAVGDRMSVIVPYQSLKKWQVVERGQSMPLAATFSCIQPQRGVHCGRCNKCAERQSAFAESNVSDPTEYAHP